MHSTTSNSHRSQTKECNHNTQVNDRIKGNDIIRWHGKVRIMVAKSKCSSATC